MKSIYKDSQGRETTMKPIKSKEELLKCSTVLLIENADHQKYEVIGLHPRRKTIILSNGSKYIERTDTLFLNDTCFEHDLKTSDLTYIGNRILEEIKSEYEKVFRFYLKNDETKIWEENSM